MTDSSYFLSDIQVQGVVKQKIRHRGQIRYERNAARIYDKRAIMANGLNAKTNFSYTKKQLDGILVDEDDLLEYELMREEGLEESDQD